MASLAALLAGCAISFGIYSHALASVTQQGWIVAVATAIKTVGTANDFVDQQNTARGEYNGIDQVGKHLVQNVERRIQWLELLRTVGACLPHDDLDKERPAEIGKRQEIHITEMKCQETNDVGDWFTGVKGRYNQQERVLEAYVKETAPRIAPAADAKAGAAAAKPAEKPSGTAAAANPSPSNAAPPGAAPAAGAASPSEQTADPGPKGKGYIISLAGYHDHNVDPEAGLEKILSDKSLTGGDFVRKTFIKNLHEMKVMLPNGSGKEEEVSMKDLGIVYPVLVSASAPQGVLIPNPNVGSDDASPPPPMPTPTQFTRRSLTSQPPAGTLPLSPNPPPPNNTVRVVRCNFIVHFCWTPTTPSIRQAMKKAAEEKLPAGAALQKP